MELHPRLGLQVVFPEYPTYLQVTNKRRKKYFRHGDEIPKKYQNANYTWKVIKGESILIDKISQEPVIKNSKVFDKPRNASINGNDIMRMFEHTRNKIVRLLKESYYPVLIDVFANKGMAAKCAPIKWDCYPLSISLEMHCTVGLGNWDLDNHWIYTKCFQDALTDLEIIPGDSIRYIAETGSVKFVPVQEENQRKLVFTISSYQGLHAMSFMMHNLWKQQFPKDYIEQKPAATPTYVSVIPYPGSELLPRILVFCETRTGKAGSVFIDFAKSEAHVSIGKKKTLFGSVKDAIASLALTCIQANCDLVVTDKQFETYPFFQTEILDRGLNLYVLLTDATKPEVSGKSQTSTN